MSRSSSRSGKSRMKSKSHFSLDAPSFAFLRHPTTTADLEYCTAVHEQYVSEMERSL